MQVSVGADFSGYGASLISASVDYKTVQSSTSSSSSRYVSSHANCAVYRARVLPEANISDWLKVAVKQLGNDSKGYIDFLNNYGTHYIEKVTMGGRYGFLSKFEESKYMTMMSTGLDVSLAAGYSGEVAVNVKASTEMQKNMSEQFNSHRDSRSIFNVGGKPPTDENGTAMAWAQTVKDNPLPIHYDLKEIADLFTKEYFENDPDIEMKQANLKNATYYYCKDTLRLSFCNSTGPENQARIKIVTSKDMRQMLDDEGTVMLYQTVNNPYYAVMGMFLEPEENFNNTGFYALVDSQKSDPELIREAINWTHVAHFANNAVRPNCEEGFSSVADFCCERGTDAPDCLSFLPPKILPCIRNECLTLCSIPTGARITNGFKVFGNGNNLAEDLNFMRFTSAGPGPIHVPDSLHMCLTSECVTDF